MSARGPFPRTRMRRLRASAFARDMVRESTLSPADLIYPVFVLEGSVEDEAGLHPKGTWFRLPPGSSHSPRTEEGCLLWVKTGHLK